MLKQCRLLAVVLALCATMVAAVASAQMLNSERIEQTFGSYGIEVLYSDESLRISDLFSEHAGEKTTRTLAIVEYPESVDESYAAEHRAILEGGSIGATFTAAGWAVIKQNVWIGEIGEIVEFTAMLGVPSGTVLAAHGYQLDIERDGQRHHYAKIFELHHPDYLRTADLNSIYSLNADALEDYPRSEEAMRELFPIHPAAWRISELELALSQ